VIETLLVAGLSGLVLGALMLGMLRAEMRGQKDANKQLRAGMNTMHARFDGLVLALAKSGLIDAGAAAHLARSEPREPT
jgi:hypothetical protein